MAERIENHLNLKTELRKSSGGRFEIFLDGEEIFSKTKTMRFPEPDEIIRLLAERMN